MGRSVKNLSYMDSLHTRFVPARTRHKLEMRKRAQKRGLI